MSGATKEKAQASRIQSDAVQLFPQRRSTPFIAAGLLFVLLSGVAGAATVASINDSTSVAVLAKDLTPGQQVSRADFKLVEAKFADDVKYVNANDLESLFGLSAKTRLDKHQLVTSSMFASRSELFDESQVIVSFRSKPGDTPVSVAAGDRVRIHSVSPPGQLATSQLLAVGPGDVDLPSSSDERGLPARDTAAAKPSPAVLGEGTIWSVDEIGETPGDVVVSIVVDQKIELAVSQGASDGLLKLNLVRG